MSVAIATTCPECGRTIMLVTEGARRRALELLEHTLRLEGDRAIPCVGIYTDHAPRCPGDAFAPGGRVA